MVHNARSRLLLKCTIISLPIWRLTPCSPSDNQQATGKYVTLARARSRTQYWHGRNSRQLLNPSKCWLRLRLSGGGRGGEGADVKMCRWEGAGFQGRRGGWEEECNFPWKCRRFPSIAAWTNSFSAPLLSTADPASLPFEGSFSYKIVHRWAPLIFVTHTVPLPVQNVRRRDRFLTLLFLPSFSQVRLQGDALQLDVLPGSPRTAPRFLSLLGGSAGEPQMPLTSVYPKLHYDDSAQLLHLCGRHKNLPLFQIFLEIVVDITPWVYSYSRFGPVGILIKCSASRSQLCEAELDDQTNSS